MLDSNSGLIRYHLLRALVICCLICFSFKTVPVHAQAPNFGWAEGFNSTSRVDTPRVGVDSSGYIHLLANHIGSIQFGSTILDPTNGTRVLAKCDSSGNVLWAVPAGNPVLYSSPYFGSANAFTVDRFGNTLIGDGFQNSATFGSLVLTNPNTNVPTAFIATFDPSGNAIKAQVLLTNLTNYSMVSAIDLDDSGNIYVAGVFKGTADFGVTNLVNGDPVYGSGFLAKYDASGHVIWAQMLPGASHALRVDATGGGYVTGSFASSTASRTAAFGDTILTNAGGRDIFVARFDNAGNWVWAKGGGGIIDDYGEALSLDAAGNCYVTGTYDASGFTHTVKFDSVTLNGAGSDDIFIAKYNTAGALLWVTNAVGSGNDIATGLAVDKSGNAYLAGLFLSSKLNMGNVTLTISPGAAYNGLVAEYSTDGRLLWTKQIVGSSVQTWDIAIDQYENAYVVGIGDATNFDNITIDSPHALWLAKIDGPRVSVSSSGNQIIVSWPTNAVGLHLESATDLNANSWSPVANATTVVGTQNTVTVNTSGNSQFFRLSGP
jgi:hypothetical protein